MADIAIWLSFFPLFRPHEASDKPRFTYKGKLPMILLYSGKFLSFFLNETIKIGQKHLLQ